MRSGLEGLSYQEAHAIRNRLRLRLNAIRNDAMVSGNDLHTAVASLGRALGDRLRFAPSTGLTKYTVAEMSRGSGCFGLARC